MIKNSINMLKGYLKYIRLVKNQKKCFVFLCDDDVYFSKKVIDMVNELEDAIFVTCHQRISNINKSIILITENDMKNIIQYISFWKNPMGVLENADNVIIASLNSEYGSFELLDLVNRKVFTLDYIVYKYFIKNNRKQFGEKR